MEQAGTLDTISLRIINKSTRHTKINSSPLEECETDIDSHDDVKSEKKKRRQEQEGFRL